VFGDYLRSGERQFAKSDRIHVVYQSMALPFGVSIPLSPMSSAPLAELLAMEYPVLDAVARAVFSERTLISAEGRTSRLEVVAADPAFLEIFDLPFRTLASANPLTEPGGAIITAAAAEALFGTADALDRTLRLEPDRDVTIIGVVDAISPPSHLAKSFLWDGFELLVPWETLRGESPDDGSGQAWFSGYGVFTYVLLPEDRSLTLAQLNASLDGFGARHVASDVAVAQFEARHVSRIVPDFYQAIFAGDAFGPYAVTDLLLALGFLALLIACIRTPHSRPRSAFRPAS
jgi:putative ABC transport system permease protein